MNKHHTLVVRVLVFRERESYIAQCLEYDIAAQGKTISEVNFAFERTLIGQIMLDVSRGKRPLEGIGRAPQEFEEMFNRAMLVEDEDQIPIPKDITPAFMVNEIRKEQRVIQ